MNFFKRFLPFLDEIFKTMMPKYQYQWIVPLVTSALGAMSGSKGTEQTGTQRIEQVRPTLTPEEQAMQNFFMNQAYGQIGQQSPFQS